MMSKRWFVAIASFLGVALPLLAFAAAKTKNGVSNPYGISVELKTTGKSSFDGGDGKTIEMPNGSLVGPAKFAFAFTAVVSSKTDIKKIQVRQDIFGLMRYQLNSGKFVNLLYDAKHKRTLGDDTANIITDKEYQDTVDDWKNDKVTFARDVGIDQLLKNPDDGFLDYTKSAVKYWDAPGWTDLLDNPGLPATKAKFAEIRYWVIVNATDDKGNNFTKSFAVYQHGKSDGTKFLKPQVKEFPNPKLPQ